MVLGCVAMTSVVAEPTCPVEFILSTPQAAYAIGDPIPVTLKIRSKDSSQVLEYRDDAFRSFYSGLRVIGPDGVILSHKRRRDGHAADGKGWVTVATNGSAVKDIDLTEVYSDITSFPNPHSLTATGAYSVVSHGREIAIRRVGMLSNLWVGAVTSAPLTIKIVGVDNVSLEAARQVLSEKGADRSLQLRAMTKMQYSDVTLTKGDLDRLRSLLGDSDASFKCKVICVLGAKASEGGFKVISDVFAAEKNPFVRSEIMGALGRYNTPAARKLLLDECKSRKDRSYIAALQVLGEAGDESCIDVLQEIAKVDETEWVRERAVESIKKIEASLPRGCAANK
jgi:hypothetical protein